MSAATLPLPTAVGPASTTRRRLRSGPVMPREWFRDRRCAPSSTTGRQAHRWSRRSLCDRLETTVPTSGAELLLERGDLLGAQPADPAALGDADPLHGLLGADLAQAGHRLQQVDDAHLADDVVALALGEHL